MTHTTTAYGPGTNPERLLEYSFDRCEAYLAHDSHRTDIIRNWALVNDKPLARSSLAGAWATDYLCPKWRSVTLRRHTARPRSMTPGP